MIIIGITGTNGAGKGTVVEYLIKKRGFIHFSFGEFIAKEITKRGLEINRDTLTKIGNEIRQKNGSDYIAKCLYQKAKKTKKNCVLESIRNPQEALYLKKNKDFFLIFLDANAKIRYHRISQRKSKKDYVSFNKFLAQEKKEMNSKVSYGQNLKEVFKMADYNIINNSIITNLNNQIEKVLINIDTRLNKN